MHFAFFGIETWMFASIFSHLTSKALTVVFQARGVIVYGSDQEVRCWKSLFVCLYGFIGTDGYHVMTSGKAQIIIQRTLLIVSKEILTLFRWYLLCNLTIKGGPVKKHSVYLRKFRFEACREKFNIPCCFPLTICASYDVSVSWWSS